MTPAAENWVTVAKAEAAVGDERAQAQRLGQG